MAAPPELLKTRGWKGGILSDNLKQIRLKNNTKRETAEKFPWIVPPNKVCYQSWRGQAARALETQRRFWRMDSRWQHAGMTNQVPRVSAAIQISR
jgi:hypothetical protein